jgi:cation:H+ antiporter
MAVAALASPEPIPVPAGLLTLDLPMMLGAAAFLLFLVVVRRKVGRMAGVFLLLAYGTYVWVLIART